jgi:hypothetical protein
MIAKLIGSISSIFVFFSNLIPHFYKETEVRKNEIVREIVELEKQLEESRAQDEKYQEKMKRKIAGLRRELRYLS